MHSRELCTVNQTVTTRSQEISYGMVETTLKSYEIRINYEILYGRVLCTVNRSTCPSSRNALQQPLRITLSVFLLSPLKQRLTLAPWNTVFDSILFCLFAGNCTNPYGKTKFFMEEIMKDVVTANPDWGCQLLR